MEIFDRGGLFINRIFLFFDRFDNVDSPTQPLENVYPKAFAVCFKVVVEARVDFTTIDNNQHESGENGDVKGGAKGFSQTGGYQNPTEVINHFVDGAAHGSALAYGLAPMTGGGDAKFQVGKCQGYRSNKKPLHGRDKVGGPSQIGGEGAV